jgi:sulfur carrier protein ThiS
VGGEIISVSVRGVGALRRSIGERVLALPVDSTVAALASALDIDTKHSPVFLVNGIRCARDARLSDGDAVTVVSLMAGG